MAYPTLNANKLISGLYNVLLNTRVFDVKANAPDALISMATEEVSGYGDTKNYYSVDITETRDYNALSETERHNILATFPIGSVENDVVVVDRIRESAITVPTSFYTKQACTSEGVFTQLTGVIESLVSKTMKLSQTLRYNAMLGTTKNTTGQATVTVALSGSAQDKTLAIAKAIQDIKFALADPSRDYTDTGFMRSFDESDLIVVWNESYLSQMEKIGLPVTYHNELGFDFKYHLPARFFGNKKSGTSGTTSDRVLEEQKIGSNHYFPGDKLKANGTAINGTLYTENPKVIAVVMTKPNVTLPNLVATSAQGTQNFYNTRARDNNLYLLEFSNTLKKLADSVMIQVVEA